MGKLFNMAKVVFLFYSAYVFLLGFAAGEIVMKLTGG